MPAYEIQLCRVHPLNPATGTTGVFNSASVDVGRGLAASVYLYLQAIAAGTTFAYLRLQGSDDNTTWVDIDGTDYSLPYNGKPAALPLPADAGRLWIWHVPAWRHRYIRIRGNITAGNIDWYSVITTYSRGQYPISDADQGAGENAVRVVTG